MENSSIEWTDHTFNPWEGCTKVSPGCANCYAETRNRRWNNGDALNWGKGAPRRRTSAANWRKPLQWNREAAAFEAEHGHRPRVFCASLADWLDDEVPVEWQNNLLRLIAATPCLDWQLLTKRPENWDGIMANALIAGIDLAHEWVNGRPPANVWIGASVEDQPRVTRISDLLRIPAKVRFLSCEPLLGPVDFERPLPGPDIDQGGGAKICQPWMIQGGIHWVISGGESGPGARPMHPNWARSLRDQCASANVPFFFKQWGEWVACDAAAEVARISDDSKSRYITYDGKLHFVDQAPLSSYLVQRVGKKAAGRLLDGIQHSAFPK